MDALYQARRGGLVMRDASWALQRAIVEQLGTIWQEPDEGIWGYAASAGTSRIPR